MTVIPMNADRSRGSSPPLLWERQLRPLVDAIAEQSPSAPRALLVGTAGSGKSATLRRLHVQLAQLEQSVHVAGADAASIGRVPRAEVLLVDDLHLLDADQIAALHARAIDPDAALIAAIRPWPSSETTRRIERMLERALPAIVLGHVGRADVLPHLDRVGRSLPERCVRHILDITGGVSWLVADALMQHDDGDCTDDDDHSELHRAMAARVSYRLDTVEASLRRDIEEICVTPAAPGGSASVAADDELFRRGHAEGLLLRNGMPVPIVRTVVLATISARRLGELGAAIAGGLAGAPADETVPDAWFGSLRDAAVGEAMMRHGDRLMDTRPARAAELYRSAERCGIDSDRLTVRLAEAHWACGDPDAAIGPIDAQTRTADDPRVADVAAGVWAARGMMAQADATYRALAPSGAGSTTHAMIAAIGVGSAGALNASPRASGLAPSTLGVSMDLLRRGLAATMVSGSDSGLADLVRAAEMYTSARARGPMPELPAVIAAIVALNLGSMRTAQIVIDDAIRGQHGGLWARQRLLLWRAWVAVQRARPVEAREALDRAREIAPAISARDELLARAVRVAIARRYEDASGLESAWRHARGALLHCDVDLYLLHPLAELISAATRMGDAARVQPHFARALAITTALGEPPLWIAHLRWAGIQQGILLGDPGVVSPHAKALVAASTEDHVAAVMAKAGRVWTSVLAGRVDAAAVEAAAEGLASVGLKWDGARLAGHGAGRTDDRKISARLLACARELHPTDGLRRAAAVPSTVPDSAVSSSDELLSERELEVARLVLQGKTYAEIGEAIFISPRTAEHHIAHIRHRLGATSRSDVIAKLRQLILDDRSETGVEMSGPAGSPASPSLPVRISG